MSTTSKEIWQKLADSWVGIAPKEAHFESWMSLNLNPPLEGHLPAEWVARESTWVDWMPNSDVASLVLEPKEALERAVMLAGAICCRALIAVSISKVVRSALVDALGADVLQRLAARPALGRIALPPAVVPLAWALKPADTLRRSGLLCLRLAVAPFPSGMESRLAAILPDPVWMEALPAFSPKDPRLAMECLNAARKLDHAL